MGSVSSGIKQFDGSWKGGDGYEEICCDKDMVKESCIGKSYVPSSGYSER